MNDLTDVKRGDRVVVFGYTAVPQLRTVEAAGPKWITVLGWRYERADGRLRNGTSSEYIMTEAAYADQLEEARLHGVLRRWGLFPFGGYASRKHDLTRAQLVQLAALLESFEAGS